MKLTNSSIIYTKLLFLFLFFCTEVTSAQPELPQRTITVAASRKLDFGLFFDYNGSGGTITIDSQGNRTTTGSIGVVPSYPGTPALFEIKLCQGRNVTITYDPTITLTDDNGSDLILNIGPTEKGGNGSIFATENNCNFTTILRIGGTLQIPPNSVMGDYNGDFELSFEQQ